MIHASITSHLWSLGSDPSQSLSCSACWKQMRTDRCLLQELWPLHTLPRAATPFQAHGEDTASLSFPEASPSSLSTPGHSRARLLSPLTSHLPSSTWEGCLSFSSSLPELLQSPWFPVSQLCLSSHRLLGASWLPGRPSSCCDDLVKGVMHPLRRLLQTSSTHTLCLPLPRPPNLRPFPWRGLPLWRSWPPTSESAL